LLVRIGELTRAIDELRAEIAVLVRPMAPGLLALSGVGDLIAARLLVEVGAPGAFTPTPRLPAMPAAPRSRSLRAAIDVTASRAWATAS